MGKIIGKVPVGVSARHVHLSEADLTRLFGEGYQLTKKKDLSQTGQFAAEETVTVVGPKRSLKMRVLGPTRSKTQVEVSRTDGFSLGIKPPVRESGVIDGSESLTIVGPKGEVEIPEGAIVAARHIHMSPADAEKFGLKDKEVVSVLVEGLRGLRFDNVIVRVRDDFVLELHLDTDEANAAGVQTGDLVTMVKPEE